MSLSFTFLCATNQAKALSLGGAFDFYKKKKLTGKTGKGFDKLDKAKKKKLLRMNVKRIKTKFLNLRKKEVSTQK